MNRVDKRELRKLEAALVALRERAMVMDPGDLLDEHDLRRDALRGERGKLWIATHRAIEALTAACVLRWECEPAALCDRGIVLGTFTDSRGVTHDWRGRGATHAYLMVGNPQPDRPRRSINCIECIARFP